MNNDQVAAARSCQIRMEQASRIGWLQVKLAEDACIRYLLQLKLSPEQLSQMMRLYDRLMLLDARKQLLKKHAHTAWVGDALEIVPALFEELIHGGPDEIELCKEVLFSEDCGALCELQVTVGHLLGLSRTGTALTHCLHASRAQHTLTYLSAMACAW